MVSTFNMGCRMEVYVPSADAKTVIDIAERFGVAAKAIGRCESATGGNKVTASLGGKDVDIG
jgi:phosphoribosylformylglycinamidine cyclo-ligase